jgi:hypothetical protein
MLGAHFPSGGQGEARSALPLFRKREVSGRPTGLPVVAPPIEMR